MKESENKVQAETRAEKVELLQSASTVSIPGVTRYASITIPRQKIENISLTDLDSIEVFTEYGSVRVRPLDAEY